MVKVIIDYTKCVEDAVKICVEIRPVSIFRQENRKVGVGNGENCIYVERAKSIVQAKL